LVSGVWETSLPGATRQLSLFVVLAAAAAVGALYGAAIAGRIRRQPENLALFSGLAAGTAGGIFGCVLALVVLGSYVFTFSGWPADHGDQILLLLAFPAFGALGFLLGAGVAGLLGLFTGTVLRLIASRQ
jgi:hypothetical protein